MQPFAAGRFVCASYTGMAHDMGQAWDKLYNQWLPASGHEPDSRPGFELYDEHYAMDAQTGAFTCWLCLPLRT